MTQMKATFTATIAGAQPREPSLPMDVRRSPLSALVEIADSSWIVGNEPIGYLRDDRGFPTVLSCREVYGRRHQRYPVVDQNVRAVGQAHHYEDHQQLALVQRQRPVGDLEQRVDRADQQEQDDVGDLTGEVEGGIAPLDQDLQVVAHNADGGRKHHAQQ